MTRADGLRAAVARLGEAGVPDPARDARLLLRWASGLDATALSVALDVPATPAEADRFADAIARRAARVPLSHITGARAFWQHSFAVGPDTLDPRPETELLVAWALEVPAPDLIVDLGTGTGCILLSLLAAWPVARGIGIDASPAALAVAERNAAALGLGHRAAFRLGDWLDGVTEKPALVVANPPYLASGELAGLDPELRHEPALALDGGPDGLGAYRRIAAGLAGVLAAGGAAFVEIGPTQAGPVAAIFADAGFGRHALRHDLDGRPRTLCFRRD